MQYNRGSFLSSIQPVTKHLLIINIIVWLASLVSVSVLKFDIYHYLGLHFWKASNFNPAQFFTYMFMHDNNNFLHIFCNMFTLFMFGSLLERVMGSKRYLFYYITCGLGAALTQELVWQFSWDSIWQTIQQSPEYLRYVAAGYTPTMEECYNSLITVGASGAVFGLLLAFAMIFPNMPMYIIPIPFPVKAKWMVLGYGLFELFFGITGSLDHVAHYAHLGGMIAGIIIILWWKRNGTLSRGYGFY
jgi:membrane associated rhomboid family serine protease